MRSTKFYRLLVVLITVLLLSTVSFTFVYAEEGGDTQPDYSLNASTLFTGVETTLDTDTATGLKMVFTDSVTAKFANKVSIKNLSLKFAFDEENTFDKLTLFYSMTFGANDNTVNFYENENGTYRVKLNENEACDIGTAATYTLLVNEAGEMSLNGAVLGNIAEPKVDAVNFNVTSSKSFNLTLKELNGVNFQVAKLTKDLTLPEIITNGSFFERAEAVAGYNYTVDYTAYDLLSSVKTKIEYVKKADYDADNSIVWKETEDDNKITFNAYDCEFKVRITATNGGNKSKTVEKVVNVVKNSKEDSIRYNITKEQYKTFQEEVLKVLKTGTEDELRINSSYKVPSLEEIISSDYFDYSALTFRTHYAYNGTSSYQSTTSLTFTLNATGSYEFYVTAYDKCKTEFTVDTENLTKKTVNEIYGWYDDEDNLVCPVFKFNVNSLVAPEITVSRGNGADGYVGTSYSVTDKFTVKGGNVTKTYKLYYMTNAQYDAYKSANGKELNKGSFDTDAEYMQAIDRLISEGKIVEIKTEDGKDAPVDLFDSSRSAFTPAKFGRYYVRLDVYDEGGNDSAMSYAINVQKAKSSATYEKTPFFQANWQSFIFLGIAVLSFIGILILLFVKPKEETNDVKVAKDAE